MRAWPVPVQILEEEKMVGGIMSMRQLGYLIGGFGLGGTGAALLPLTLFFRFLVFCMVFVAGVALARVRVEDIPLDVFLWRAWRWWRSQRQFCLRGDD